MIAGEQLALSFPIIKPFLIFKMKASKSQEYKKAHGENNSGNFWDQHV